jgi:hypothetical protein
LRRQAMPASLRRGETGILGFLRGARHTAAELFRSCDGAPGGKFSRAERSVAAEFFRGCRGAGAGNFSAGVTRLRRGIFQQLPGPIAVEYIPRSGGAVLRNFSRAGAARLCGGFPEL